MKRILYIFFLGMLLASCADSIVSDSPNNRNEDLGDKVRIHFTLDIPVEQQLHTRTMGEMNDDKRLSLALRLFVFDQNGFFVESATAVNKTNDNSFETARRNQTNFEVTLTKSNSPRRIHFVALDTLQAGNKKFEEVIAQKYSYGSEVTMMNGMSVADSTDAYWQRLEKTVIDENTTFERVPLIRNFAKFTIRESSALQSSGHFSIKGFAVVNRPTTGSIAPYNSQTGAFAVYHSGEDVKSYQTLTSEHYYGYQPQGEEWMDTDASTVPFTSQQGENAGKPIYIYESPNATGDGIKGRTYVIVKGDYTPSGGTAYYNRYYKIDIIYKDDEGAAGFYNILRNFNYEVIVNAVTFEGYATPEEAGAAPASNNISASVQAQNVNNISDGSARRLFLNKLYFVFTDGGQSNGDVQCKFYGYTNDAATTAGWSNDKINVSIVDGSDDIFEENPMVDTNSEDATSHFCNVKFKLKEPTAIPQSATLRFYVHGVERFETLYRDVTIVLRQPYSMLVDCPDVVTGTTGTDVNVKLLVQDGINSSLFPMTFYLEPAAKTIYPNASNSDGIIQPVHVGKSIVTGSTANSFQYERTVTSDEYSNAETRTEKGVVYRIITCPFKSNTTASATTVYAQNEYCAKANDNFVNGTAVFPENGGDGIKIIGSDYFGAGNTYNYVTFQTVRATAGVNVTLTLNDNGGGTPVTRNIALNTGTYNSSKRVYEYTVSIPTLSFDGSEYTATLTYSGEYTQTLEGAGTRLRRYLYIPLGAFQPAIGVNGYDTEERFRSAVTEKSSASPWNTGRVGMNLNGITETGNRSTDGSNVVTGSNVEYEATYEGFRFADDTGYHIDAFRNNVSITRTSNIYFHDPSSGHNPTWYGAITALDMTSRHAIDWQGGYTNTNETSAPANGLLRCPLTFHE